MKCKPGWDTEVFDAVRNRWPGIALSCDANSAYKLKDAEIIVGWDAFDLMMIEQPLWNDDFYYHSMLQRQLNTPICLDESIHNRRDTLAAIEMESCRIINIKTAVSADSAKPSPCTMPRWSAAFPSGAEACSKPVSAAPTTSPCPRSKTSPFPVTFPPPSAITRKTSSSRQSKSHPGEITVPTTPGRGYEVREDLVERLTIRKEEIRAMAFA